MSDPHTTLPALDGPGDAELISAVRAGDIEAYGTLFERHVEAARRLARQLVSAGDVDDLVSDAFSKVLGVLQKGGGPDLAFRAYLLTSLRRLHVDKIRANSRLTTTDDMTAYDPGVPFEDTAVSGFDNETAAKAYARLPERWQQVLWHTEVEGQKPAEIAPLLGMSPNSVSALAYRAREGLRQAFISMHAQDAVDDVCATTRANMGAYIRNGLSRRDSTKVEAHLQECRPCTAIYLELNEVNSNLGALLAPLVLGSAGAGYLAAAAAGSKAGILLFFGGVKNWLLHNPAGRATGVGAGVAAAAVAIAAVAAGGGEPKKPVAHETPPAASTPAPGSTPAPSKPQAKPKPHPKSTPATPPQTTPRTTPPTTPPSPPPTTTPEEAPVISSPIPNVTVKPGTSSVVIDLTNGATDPNGDPLTVQSASVASPSHGTVTRGGTAGRPVVTSGGGGGKTGLGGAVVVVRPASGPTTVTYTPQRGWRGTDTIRYTLTDGHGGTVDGSVQVTTPNTAPTVSDFTVRADRVTPTWIRPLDHASDVNHDSLQMARVTQPKTGKIKRNRDGSLTYYSDPAAAPYTTRFHYTVSDGHGGQATGTVTVQVTADIGLRHDTGQRGIPRDRYEHIRLDDFGLPPGRRARLIVTLSGADSWKQMPGIDSPTMRCASLPSSPSGNLKRSCTFTGTAADLTGSEVLHFDFVACSDWTFTAKVLPVRFADADLANNRYRASGTRMSNLSVCDSPGASGPGRKGIVRSLLSTVGMP